MITTTLKRIKKHRPRQNVWEKLLNGLGKKKADGEPLSFATILEINGIHDALWCCRVEPQYAKEWQLLAVAFARRVEHFNTDSRLKNVIDVAERYANGEATDEELRVATRVVAWGTTWAAARGAVRDVVRDAAKVAAWDAAWDAARAAARGNVWDAAWDAAKGAAWNAAWAAARDTVRVAAWGTAWDAEREWQTQEFLRVITETEEKTV